MSRGIRDIVGRIVFINADGGIQFTAQYGIPNVLRDPELFTEHGIFYQNHQKEDGQWVYKYLRPLGAGRLPDSDLSDYRHPADADWDGPAPARAIACWEHVNAKLGEFIRSGCTTLDLLNLQALAHAAFHKLAVPDVLELPEPAIPTSINIDLATPSEEPVDPTLVIE